MSTTDVQADTTEFFISTCTIIPTAIERTTRPARDAADEVGYIPDSPDMKLMRIIARRLMTAEITWLSVREETNIPIEIRDAPSRKKARRAAYAPVRCTVPNIQRMSG